MAQATGKRILAWLCFLAGLFTIIGIPLFWPLAYGFHKKAKQQEAEREREIEALEEIAESES